MFSGVVALAAMPQDGNDDANIQASMEPTGIDDDSGALLVVGLDNELEAESAPSGIMLLFCDDLSTSSALVARLVRVVEEIASWTALSAAARFGIDDSKSCDEILRAP